MEQKPDNERSSPPPDDPVISPRHGFQGDRGGSARPRGVPAGVTIAISREAGARGGTIGRRVGRLLGWQVYDQEMLEYIAGEGTICQEVVENIPAAAESWCRERLEALARDHGVDLASSAANLARVILALGAQGQAVLIGRGAGLILPRESTLNLRIIAPLADRIGYMSQWLRLTVEEAAERVRLRDSRRADFLATHFHGRGGDLYQYDLLLNSSLLGEELCAELIVRAARAKAATLAGE
jgi:cytidylate kinase